MDSKNPQAEYAVGSASAGYRSTTVMSHEFFDQAGNNIQSLVSCAKTDYAATAIVKPGAVRRGNVSANSCAINISRMDDGVCLVCRNSPIVLTLFSTDLGLLAVTAC